LVDPLSCEPHCYGDLLLIVTLTQHLHNLSVTIILASQLETLDEIAIAFAALCYFDSCRPQSDRDGLLSFLAGADVEVRFGTLGPKTLFDAGSHVPSGIVDFLAGLDFTSRLDQPQQTRSDQVVRGGVLLSAVVKRAQLDDHFDATLDHQLVRFGISRLNLLD
jgi:hypothetical protein